MERILIVDDEKHIRDLYSLELSSEGYRVETRASCSGLPEELELSKPDLIVLDIRMVDHDGLEILVEIRRRHADLPIILCSAYDSFRHDARAIAADAYVVKSFDLSDLKLKIQRALQARISEGLNLLPGSVDAQGGEARRTTNPIIGRDMECIGLS